MGVPIEVRVDASWSHLGCNIENRRPQVLTPGPDHFPDGSVVHEVLHIRRIRAQGVPQLVDEPEYPQWNPAIPKALASLDNSLEHLVIVPEEIAMRPERRDWWESRIEHVWLRGIPGMPDQEDQRRQALINWTFLEHVVPGAAARPAARQLLTRLGATDEVQQMHGELMAAVDSKEEMVRICFGHFALDTRIALFRYFGVRTGHSWTAHI